MPARTQSKCYPAMTVAAACSRCYTGESNSCRPSFGDSQNSLTTCASCNISGASGNCVSSQNYCNISRENINTHEDVGTFVDICELQGELIFRNWTAAWWNDLQNDFLTARVLGKTQPHNGTLTFTPVTADPTNNPHPANSLVTAEKYNQMSAAAIVFRNPATTCPTVTGISTGGTGNTGNGTGDVIKVAHSAALRAAFNNARFNTNVCDICNTTASQLSCSYNCSCNYDCTYNCQYNCSCNYGCGAN